jgi:sugar lactone lactonase YvrE
VSCLSNQDSTLVGALDKDGEVWQRWIDTGGAFPAGLLVENNGDLVMVDEQALLYRVSADGQVIEQKSTNLQTTLTKDQASPLHQVVIGPGVGLNGGDQFFVLVPEHPRYHVFGRTLHPNGTFVGLLTFDVGVGRENGQTLYPVALAFDRQRTRLLVLDIEGRLQVFDAAQGAERRYITKWGGFGSEEGEFMVSSQVGAAMVVDSQGMIAVMDGSGRIQVFAPKRR